MQALAKEMSIGCASLSILLSGRRSERISADLCNTDAWILGCLRCFHIFGDRPQRVEAGLASIDLSVSTAAELMLKAWKRQQRCFAVHDTFLLRFSHPRRSPSRSLSFCPENDGFLARSIPCLQRASSYDVSTKGITKKYD